MESNGDAAGPEGSYSGPMIHLFINSFAASAGGGLTYIRNVLPLLAVTPHVRVTVALASELREEFSNLDTINFLRVDIPPARRFWYEQSRLSGLIQDSGAQVLLSTGNFAMRRSPVPQILLSRNSIYTSADFYRDLLSRNEYRLWLDTRFRAALAKKSIDWADATVAPSAAFAAELTEWTGKPVTAIHHGFDGRAFARDSSSLGQQVEDNLASAEGALKLLFVSHYNYYRNFETLIRALPILRNRVPGRSVKVLLTCRLGGGHNRGGYRSQSAAKLIKALGVSDMIVELGAVPYCQLHHVYTRADFYVTPAYTETFAHPLVEAMASGVPVIASDLAVHKEICGDAALYFSKFSPENLAATVATMANQPELAKTKAMLGKERSRAFSWIKHIDQILALSSDLVHSSRNRAGSSREGMEKAL